MAEEIRVEVEGGAQPKRRRSPWRWLLLLPGLFFVGMGVLVIAVPEVITAMVAAMFFLVGLAFLMGAAKMGRRASGRGATFFFDGRFESR